MPTDFSLIPFPGSNAPSDIKLSGTLSRKSNILSVNFSIAGPVDQILIPVSQGKPARAMNLWEETCFEFFLLLDGSQKYWEFNLSPSGNWNVFRFNSYRNGMSGETAFSSLPFKCDSHPDNLSFEFKLNLDPIVPPTTSFKAGVTTVIKAIDGKISYWALAHLGREADFHRPDSFLLKL